MPTLPTSSAYGKITQVTQTFQTKKRLMELKCETKSFGSLKQVHQVRK